MSKKQSLFNTVTPIEEELIDDKPTHQEQQIEQNIKKIFSSEQSRNNYIQNLQTLYTTFDQLSKQIQTLGVKLEFGSSQDEENALQSLNIIKTNLLTELSKFEKQQESLKSIADNNPIENLDKDNIKSLQLYLDEAKLITANLTEALDYDEKIKHLQEIRGFLKEMTEPGNSLEFNKIFTNNLKNIVPSFTEGKKKSSKENHDINHELDRMLKEILEEQGKLLSLLVTNTVLLFGEEKELFNNFSKKNAEIDEKIKNNNESKKLTAAKQKYIKLCQQEYKLRTIKQSPDNYIVNNAVTEKLNKDIKTLRKEIIALRQNSSAIQKESDELERKKFATGIVERFFNRIFYGSDEAINKKVEALEAKKEEIDNRVLALTAQYQGRNQNRTKNSQLYNAIRTNSPDKLKSVIPDLDPIELYNKLTEQRKAATTQAIKKESWVKRIFSSKSKNQGQAISKTK